MIITPGIQTASKTCRNCHTHHTPNCLWHCCSDAKNQGDSWMYQPTNLKYPYWETPYTMGYTVRGISKSPLKEHVNPSDAFFFFLSFFLLLKFEMWNGQVCKRRDFHESEKREMKLQLDIYIYMYYTCMYVYIHI